MDSGGVEADDASVLIDSADLSRLASHPGVERDQPAEPCGRPGGAIGQRAAPERGVPLADPFGRRITYLRFAITENCNLRCTYCRPGEEAGVPTLPPALSRREIVRLSALFVRLGVQKIRLTGGEPTLHPELVSIVEELAALSPAPLLALTTNGVLLPKLAERLKRSGLSRVNISLDAASPEGFRRMTGRDRWERVRAGIDAAIAAGFERVKINAVILAGMNEDEILPLALLARDLPVDVRFIEYMPLTGNGWHRDRHLSADEIERRIATEIPLEPASKESNDGPARLLRVSGFLGRIGFISPLSVPFCSDCNRVRVTARGTLRLCLLGGGEADLVGPLRNGDSDDRLAERVREALAGKAERHDVRPESIAPPECGSPMWATGG